MFNKILIILLALSFSTYTMDTDDLTIIERLADMVISNEELIDAIKVGNVARARKLINKGASANARNMLSGRTVLHEAVIWESLGIVNLLLTNGANINEICDGGYTALHYAVWQEKKEIVELLLKSGADTRIKNKLNLTASDFAEQKNNLEIKELINNYMHMPKK